MEQKYSLRSPAVKRLMREAKELHKPTALYYAQPLEDNLFEWHFTVRGPPDTEFAGGCYHGRIILPPEYPMKPPSIMLLTPNGRFEVGKKICLSMSAHHPETWQPSWSIRTVLMAIIGFMPTKGAGAIGALDYTPKERSILAKRSLEWSCSTCGPFSKHVLLDEGSDSSTTKEVEREIAEIAGQIAFKEDDEKNKQKEQSQTESNPNSSATPSPDFPPSAFDSTASAFPSNSAAFSGLQPNPWLQASNQQPPYMAYNPYYQFGYPYFGSQMPPQIVGHGAMPVETTTNQNPLPTQSTNQNVAETSTNQNGPAGASANQNTGSESSNPAVRQRVWAGQPNGQTQVVAAQSSGVVAQMPPGASNTGMASLIFLWLVAVSVIALILRRIFMA